MTNTVSDHTAISVRDLGRSVAFYCDVLDGRVVEEIGLVSGREWDALVGLRNVRARGVMLDMNGHKVELWEYKSPKGKPYPRDRRVSDVGITHFALSVKNIEDVYSRLLAKGVRFYSSPQNLGKAKAAYLLDPDGITIEILEWIDEKST